MYSKSLFIKCALAQILLILIAIGNEFFLENSNSQGFNIEFGSTLEKFLTIILFGPILETIIFNVGLNELLSTFLDNKTFILVISSFLFGLTHYYSFVYIIFTFLSGLVFNILYFQIKKTKPWWFAGTLVFIIHANHNLIGFLLGK